MYKLVAFDVDDTLAPSKQSISKEMAVLLNKLSKITKVAIISGASFERLEKQLLCCIPPSPNMILLPGCGSERFEYKKDAWVLTDKEPFPPEIKKRVFATLEKIIADPKFEVPPYPAGKIVEDRDTEITFSGLGQEALPPEKEKWDPDKTRRQKIKAALEQEVPEIVALVGGTTSIDILPKGFDKAKGLKLLLKKEGLSPDDVLFIGDAIIPGGNDYSVFEAGIKSIPVSGPAQTMEVIEKMIQETVTEPEFHSLPELPPNPVVYFCAEFAFEPNSSMYAGGLGILAGDYVYQNAELDKAFIGIGIRYGKVIPTGFGLLSNTEVEIPVGGFSSVEKIQAKVWHRAFSKNTHVFLLDAGDLTEHIYHPDFYIRVRQQLLLGLGGVRLLKKLNISPKVYHLNEGHTAFVAVALMVERPEDYKKIVCTKHTVLSAAGLQISSEDLMGLLGPYCAQNKFKFEKIFEKGDFELNPGHFSTTKFLIESAKKKNGVSALHVVYEKKRHPHSKLIPITNGVYRKRWQARELFTRTSGITDDELWKIKRKLRFDLFSYVETTTGKKFSPDICTLVWARRFAEYKRPYLMFSSLERLTQIITNNDRPLQIVISGKAHPADEVGQEIVRKVIAYADSSLVKGKVVYLPDYNILSSEKMTRGADLWLNTPELGMEACGTSGMKAGLNGALQVSVKDGWVDEISLDGRGWSLPGDKNTWDTAEVLYDLLEHEILPMYYGDHCEGCTPEWISRMRSTIEIVEKSYTGERMLKDYEERLYTW